MPLVLLVLVVGFLVLEDDVQGHVKFPVVDRPIQFFGQGAGCEKDLVGVFGEVLPARVHGLFLGLGRIILQREVDIMS